MDKQQLAKYEIDYDKGVKNCMGDPAFFKNLLSMFLEDSCFPRAREAFAARDYKAMFAALHELKGVSGNAALDGIYSAIVPLVELLRGGSAQYETVAELFAAADEKYQKTCEGIKLALA